MIHGCPNCAPSMPCLEHSDSNYDIGFAAGLAAGRQEMQGAVTQAAREIRRLEKLAEEYRVDKQHFYNEWSKLQAAHPAIPTSDQEK